MGHVQHLSFESLVKMDHFQKGATAKFKCRQKRTYRQVSAMSAIDAVDGAHSAASKVP